MINPSKTLKKYTYFPTSRFVKSRQIINFIIIIIIIVIIVTFIMIIVLSSYPGGSERLLILCRKKITICLKIYRVPYLGRSTTCIFHEGFLKSTITVHFKNSQYFQKSYFYLLMFLELTFLRCSQLNTEHISNNSLRIWNDLSPLYPYFRVVFSFIF